MNRHQFGNLTFEAIDASWMFLKRKDFLEISLLTNNTRNLFNKTRTVDYYLSSSAQLEQYGRNLDLKSDNR